METVCEHCGRLTTVRKAPPSGVKKSPVAKEVITYYCNMFKEKFGHEPNINWAACTLSTNKMLKTRTKEELKSKLDEFIEQDGFFRQAGYTYLLFPDWLQKNAVNGVNKPVENKKQWDGLL